MDYILVDLGGKSPMETYVEKNNHVIGGGIIILEMQVIMLFIAIPVIIFVVEVQVIICIDGYRGTSYWLDVKVHWL